MSAEIKKTPSRMVSAPTILEQYKKQNVAIYTRVSSDFGTRSSSINSQERGLERMVKEHVGWEYYKTYTDEGISGTKENRPAFMEMLDAARRGEIDIIVTKSVSRFGRNLATSLKLIKELRELEVDIWFVDENLHSKDSACDMLLTLMATFAEAYAKSASKNQKVAIRHQFEKGIPTYNRPYGYRMVNAQYFVVPEEAEVVKRIYESYLSGMGLGAIVKKLREDKIPPLKSAAWGISSVRHILKNEIYTGKLILQKTFIPDDEIGCKRINNGELNKYEVANAHAAIVTEEMYEAVQKEFAMRGESAREYDNDDAGYVYTGMMKCGHCGKTICFKVKHCKQNKRKVWICPTYNHLGKENCPVTAIPENSLDNATKKAILLHDGSVIKNEDFEITRELVQKMIRSITAHEDRKLEYVFRDGKSVMVEWELVSRKNSWTEEMKAEARKKAILNMKRKE